MSGLSKILTVCFGFTLGLTLILAIAIVQDNKYDSLVMISAIEHNCSVVDTSKEITITCPDPKIEAELNEVKK